MTSNNANSGPFINLGDNPFVIISAGPGPRAGGPTPNLGAFTANTLNQAHLASFPDIQRQFAQFLASAATKPTEAATPVSPTPVRPRMIRTSTAAPATAAAAVNPRQKDVIAPRRGHAARDAPNQGEVADTRPSVFARIGDRVQGKKPIHDRLVFPANYDNQASHRHRHHRAARPHYTTSEAENLSQTRNIRRRAARWARNPKQTTPHLPHEGEEKMDIDVPTYNRYNPLQGRERASKSGPRSQITRPGQDRASSAGSQSPNKELYDTYRTMKGVQRTESSKPAFYRQKKVALDKLEDIMKRMPGGSPESKGSPSRASSSSHDKGKRPVSASKRFTCHMTSGGALDMEATLNDGDDEDDDMDTSVARHTRLNLKRGGKGRLPGRNKPAKETTLPPPAGQMAQEAPLGHAPAVSRPPTPERLSSDSDRSDRSHRSSAQDRRQLKQYRLKNRRHRMEMEDMRVQLQQLR